MIRVAILSPTAELGGAERSLLTFLKAAHGRMVEASVIVPRPGPLCDHLASLGVPCITVSMPQALLCQSRRLRVRSITQMLAMIYEGPVYLSRLAKVVRRLSPKVLYSNGIKSHILAVSLRALMRVPTVWHVRDHWGGTVVGYIADVGTDFVIANSRATAAVVQRGMRRPEKVIVVHNAVDATEFSPDGPVEDTGDVRQGTLKVGLPAALTQIKGHELLLRAAMRIQKEIPSVNFYFIGGTIYDTVGDRGYEDKLRRSVKEKGLEPSVVFTGFQEKMAPWYRAMDIVVNASTVPEGFGRTLLEAMACGKAVAGPNAGGIPEFVRHGENGLLYEMGNADALADTILTLLHDPALRQRLASSGRETAIHRFTTEPYAKAISQVLHDAAGNSASTFLRLPHSPDYALKNVRSAQ